MAPAFSTSARLLATLLLLALSLVAWKWLMRPVAAQTAAGSSAVAGTGAKKNPRKKSKKKSKKADEPVPSAPRTALAAAQAEVASDGFNSAGDVSDSDSDSVDGRSAAQVLATRRFKPAALGGVVPSATPAGPRFELGQRVSARFQGGDAWFPAVVTEVRRGNTYHLRYDDGETEFHVAAALIRTDTPPDGAEAASGGPSPSRAEDVDATAVASDAPSRQGREDDGSDDGNAQEDDEEDGWHVVSRAASSKSAKTAAVAAPEGEKLVDGLTKRQRENRRKKERQREIKEMARLQAQSGEFDARARMKYVPPPTSAGQ